MVKVKKDGKIQEVAEEVAVVLTLRYGFEVTDEELDEEEQKDEIKAKLEALGVEYHPNLGLKKLNVLLKENE